MNISDEIKLGNVTLIPNKHGIGVLFDADTKKQIADEMFEELGYRIYLNNDDTLIYKKQSDFFRISITFDKREFKKTFNAVESSWIAKNSEVWVTQKFRDEFDKYCSANGHWSMIWHDYSMPELQAINKKCKELGWI